MCSRCSNPVSFGTLFKSFVEYLPQFAVKYKKYIKNTIFSIIFISLFSVNLYQYKIKKIIKNVVFPVNLPTDALLLHSTLLCLQSFPGLLN